MRALVAVLGTLGDVYPMLSIAMELQKRKHVVVFAAAPHHRRRIEEAGFEFRLLRPDFGIDVLRYFFSNRSQLNSRFLKFLTFSVRDTFVDLLRYSQDTDIILAGEIVYPARLIAHTRKIPWINCVFAPYGVEGAASAGFGAPEASETLRCLCGGELPNRAQAIKKVGLALHSLCREHNIATSAIIARPDATLGLFSPCLIDSSVIQNDRVRVVGFTRYQGPPSALPGRLMEFVQVGRPPIMFVLGSTLIHGVDRSFYEVAISAAAQLDCRAVLLTGSGEDAMPRNIPSDGSVFTTGEYVSYAALFQTAKLVVHHGGIGTLATALRAEVPAVIIPFAFDQAHNAVVAQQRGIARALALQDYRLDTLTSELSVLLHEPMYTNRVRELGSVVRGENGAEMACQIIERCVGSRPERMSETELVAAGSSVCTLPPSSFGGSDPK